MYGNDYVNPKDLEEVVDKEIRFRTMTAYKYCEMKSPMESGMDVPMTMYFKADLAKVVVATVPMNAKKTEFAVEVAICSPKDGFNRKLGQAKAKKRLMGRILGGSAIIFSVANGRTVKSHIEEEVSKLLKNKKISFLEGVTGVV